MVYTFKQHIEKKLRNLGFDRDNIEGILLLLEDNSEIEKKMYEFLNNTKLTSDSRDAIFKYARYISDNWYPDESEIQE